MKSDKENIVFCQIDQNSLKEISIYEGGVSAGFPSPAEDYLDIDLNLHQHLVKHPSSTFFVIAKGNSMHDSGIHNNDLLVVDKSLDARNNDIIIAALNGEFLVKRYLLKNDKVYLRAENELESYPTITITEDMDFEVWGIVTHTIHSNR